MKELLLFQIYDSQTLENLYTLTPPLDENHLWDIIKWEQKSSSKNVLNEFWLDYFFGGP